MDPLSKKYYPFLVGLILILLLPALFIHLGLMPLIADEATRALVSLEMELSGNLLAPTINGEYYFNKPPLYNWYLLTFFELSGKHSEFIVRLPAVLSLLIFGLVIYTGVKRTRGKRTAFISALAFISCGRILFYDSLLGLIDISFSLLIFINFLLIYRYLRKENYYRLFLLSYFITAIAFLMKGLPAILFQVLTITAGFIFFKRWKKIFSFSHLAGALLFLSLAGAYYYLLFRQNPETRYFETILKESAKRTFIEHGIWKTILHIFTYPAEQLYHLLPWSLLLIFLLKRSFYDHVKKSQFLSFLALVFLVNIPVYWISVESYPRYVFMLYPVIFILLIDYYFHFEKTDFLRKIFPSLLIIFLLATIAAMIWIYLQYDFYNPFRVGIIFSSALIINMGLIYLIWRKASIRLELLVILLLITRISFNLGVLPERQKESRLNDQKTLALQAAEITEGKVLYLRPWSGISHETSFYLTRERQEILEIWYENPEQDTYYIISGRDPDRSNEKVIFRFETRWRNYPLKIVQYE